MIFRPRAVLLDLDDTLYLERDYVAGGFRAVGAWLRERYGVVGFDRLCQRLFDQGRRGDVFDAALAELELAHCIPVAELVRVYRDHRPEIRLLPDARRLLERLAGRVPLALVTDGPARVQRHKILALEIAPRFDIITLTDELGRAFWKPHPRPFRETLAALRVAPEEALWVADNPRKDFLAPRRLGMACVRVRRPGGIYAHLPTGPEGVDLELTDLDELELAPLQPSPA